MRKRKRQLDQRQQICLGLNLLIIFAELLGLYLRFYILGSPGLEYYTVLSNILTLVASSFMVYDFTSQRQDSPSYECATPIVSRHDDGNFCGRAIYIAVEHECRALEAALAGTNVLLAPKLSTIINFDLLFCRASPLL